jgi:outer membrane protein TolC
MSSRIILRKLSLVRFLGMTLGAVIFGNGPAPLARAADPNLSLPQAVRQAIESNLDLIAQRQSLAASREEIGLARSVLLPQLDVGARGQYIDDERPDQARGNNTTGSFLVGAGLSQVIYDEESWAGFSIQKHVYDGLVKQLVAYQLGVVQDAADAFINLDSAQHVLEIQERNRQITRENLEKSRARISAGWSSEGEILRWHAQLASNDTEVRRAQVSVLQNLLELNRVRNMPPETFVAVVPATLADYAFVYADQSIASAVVEPEQDRQMRDYLVRAGIARSPDLAALDFSIAAGERQLTANRRAFWIPTVSFNAGVDYLTNHSSVDDDFNQTEWGVKGVVAFPVFQGGAKFAGLDQARAALQSLRTDRRATAQSLEQVIRAAFAQATGSFESVGFARREVSAAQESFELIDQSYILGIASFLDLLDAQTQRLQADLTLNNATYGFLVDLIAAERSISFYSFVHEPKEVEGILDGITRELQLQP